MKKTRGSFLILLAMVQPSCLALLFLNCPDPVLCSDSMHEGLEVQRLLKEEEAACFLFWLYSWLTSTNFLIAKKHGVSATSCITSSNLHSAIFPAQWLILRAAWGLWWWGEDTRWFRISKGLGCTWGFICCCLPKLPQESCDLVSEDIKPNFPYSLSGEEARWGVELYCKTKGNLTWFHTWKGTVLPPGWRGEKLKFNPEDK